MEDNIIDIVFNKAKGFFSGLKGAHDFEHTLRVYNLAVKLAEKEDADLEVVKIAALLHDIARKEEDKANGKICHAEKGAEIANRLLIKLGLDKNKVDNIVHCIKSHRFKGSNVPKTIEAKVLYDADKLDSIGAIGIGRAFHFSGEFGAKVHNKDVDVDKTKPYTEDDTAYREYLVKLRHVKDKMQTKEGKRIAEERHNFMVEFFDRINKEVDGVL